jgi:hypothetical protein
MNIMRQNHIVARQHFAVANGWRCGAPFNFDLLIRNKANHGGDYYANYSWQQPDACDHVEYYRIGGRPVAIIAHNYPRTEERLRQLIDGLAGRLVLHVPAAGKAASWHYPDGCLPMALTRPDIIDIVWPTHRQMAATAATYFTERDRSRSGHLPAVGGVS